METLTAEAVYTSSGSKEVQAAINSRYDALGNLAYVIRPLKGTGDYPALPQLGHQIIHPYTDLLLHDMGEGLADGRPDFLAGPRDWRTPPLWGIALSNTVNGNASLLHDGRARNLIEAILWHGGEAEVSREAFRGMTKPEREALLAFLSSL